MSIDRFHHALPAEVTFEGKVYPLYNFGQLDRCNKASLKSRALDLCDGVGRDRLPPLNYHNKEDMIVWILQVESALALGQGLRGPFGDQVTPLTLGMPKNYVEDNMVSDDGYFTGTHDRGGGGSPVRTQDFGGGGGGGGYDGGYSHQGGSGYGANRPNSAGFALEARSSSTGGYGGGYGGGGGSMDRGSFGRGSSDDRADSPQTQWRPSHALRPATALNNMDRSNLHFADPSDESAHIANLSRQRNTSSSIFG